MFKAYLMGTLDITASPPVLVSVGIFSHKNIAHQLNKTHLVELLCTISYNTFEEAADVLKDHVAMWMPWVQPLMMDMDAIDEGLASHPIGK